MSRLLIASAFACVCLTGMAATCSTAPREITAAKAIEIARSQVTFEVVSVETSRVTEEGRRAWRVTLRGKPVSPDHPLLRPIVTVFIDRESGDVISIAKS